MTKVTIDRELLEQVASEFEHDNDRYMLGRELRKILDAPHHDKCEEPVAWMNPYGGVLQKRITGLERETFTIPLYTAPRQPEGEGLEVVESLHVWRATNRFGDTCHFGDAGCARAWAGNGGKVDRIELKPVPELYDVNHTDAAEVSATEIKVVAWVHCADATRLLCDLGKQRSVPGHYADEFTIPLCRLSDHQRAIAELQAERDTLRQQRDRLAEALETMVCAMACHESTPEECNALHGARAALAEVKPCQESPAPTT